MAVLNTASRLIINNLDKQLNLSLFKSKKTQIGSHSGCLSSRSMYSLIITLELNAASLKLSSVNKPSLCCSVRKRHQCTVYTNLYNDKGTQLRPVTTTHVLVPDD